MSSFEEEYLISKKRRLISDENETHIEYNTVPILKKYIDVKIESMKQEILTGFQDIARQLEQSNAQMINQVTSIINNYANHVEHITKECLQQQNNNTSLDNETSFTLPKKREIRCPALSAAIREYHAEMHESGEGWDLKQIFSTSINQGVANKIFERIISENTDEINLIRNHDGTELISFQKMRLVASKIKRHFINLRHEYTNREKGGKVTVDKNVSLLEKNRRRTRKHHKLDRRLKYFNANKNIVLNRVNSYLNEEDLRAVFDVSLMSDEETDEESTVNDKIFVVHKPMYRSSMLSDFLNILDTNSKKNNLKESYIDKCAPNTALQWMVDLYTTDELQE